MTDEPHTTTAVSVVDATRLDDCRALWLSLRDHHAETDPVLGPVRGDADSWTRFLAVYEPALQSPDGFLVLAEAPGEAPDAPLACAIVAVKQSGPTWGTVERLGDVDVLAVAPGARGLGIGSAVLDAVQEELHRRGVGEMRLTVTAGNLGAQAFYREIGFDTFALVLRRTAPAPPPR